MERNSYENFTLVILLLIILCSTGGVAGTGRMPKDNTPKGSRVYTLGFELILRGEVEIQKDTQPDYKLAIPNLLLGELLSKHQNSDKIEPYTDIKGMDVLRDHNKVNTNTNTNTNTTNTNNNKTELLD